MPPRKAKRPDLITTDESSSDSDSEYCPSASYPSDTDTESESESGSMADTSDTDGETINTESDESDEELGDDADSLADFIVPDEVEINDGESEDGASDGDDEEEDDDDKTSKETGEVAPTVRRMPMRSARLGHAYRIGTISLPCKRLGHMMRALQRKEFEEDEDDTDDDFAPTRKRARAARIKHYTHEENAYFFKMSPEDQAIMKTLEDALGDAHKATTRMPLRFRLLKSDADIVTKRLLLTKLDSLNNMSGQEGDYHKMSNWLQSAARLPLGRYISLPVQRDAGIPAIRDFLEQTRTSIDAAVYGHRESKEQIMRILAQWISNPHSRGHCIGIQGAMGVGKSSLVKEGIAKALNLPFAYIALGGAADGAFLEGHSITYEGSTPGKIAEVVMKTECMNPVIFFDELDKVSETAKGEEVANILVHLTDAAQNEHFNDKFFTEIDLNLSKALMVFAFNDETKINPILLDRMTLIRVSGYNTSDKLAIARNHLLPSILEQHGIENDVMLFTDDILKTIMERVPDEKGVRNFRRGLESIVSWFNMLQYLPDPEFDMTFDMIKPYDITEAFVRKYLKKQGGAGEQIQNSMYL